MKRNAILKNLLKDIDKDTRNYIKNCVFDVKYPQSHIWNFNYFQYKIRYLYALMNNMTLSEYVQSEYELSETESLDYVNSLPDSNIRNDKLEFSYFKKYVDKLLKDAD